jgi:hypothetical protein
VASHPGLVQEDEGRRGSGLRRLFRRDIGPVRVSHEKAVKLKQRDSWDEVLLEELCRAMVGASICGLGQALPNPIRFELKYFADEVGIARTGKPIRDDPIKRW